MELQEQEKIMQITTSWEQKGRQEGRIEEKLSITLRQLKRKLGNLPDNIATRIKSLESSKLDVLTEDLLDFKTLDDLNQWLSNC
jgi:predicted transposase YdaD